MQIKDRLTTNPKASATSSGWDSLSSTRLFLRKQLWIWPLIAAVLLSAIGYWMRAAVNRSLKENIASQLQVVLEADLAALKQWMRTQEANASAAAKDRDVTTAVRALIDYAATEPSSLAVFQSAEFANVQAALVPWLALGDYEDFIVVNAMERIVGSPREEMIGKEKIPQYHEFLDRVLKGETLVSRPYRSTVMLTDNDGELRAGVPTMFVCTPIKSTEGQIIGGLGFRLRPEEGFTDVLQLSQMGKTGETYAFDKSGLMLSQSRFDEDLKAVGLLTDEKQASSILTLELRDPGVDLMRGNRSPLRRSQQPLTLPAQTAAKNGKVTIDVEGHRDYRGVQQVGAWTWLDKYGFGIANEVDFDEAFAASRILDYVFWGMFALLAAMALAIFVFSIVTARLQQRMLKAELTEKKLGQYRLEEKLGEGGMGVVYRGRHAMLRRPTAIKLLDLHKTSDEAIGRFEREVQITSQLNHPNTIAIYDYGRTPEGIFYYAMEFLDGMDLERFVRQYGPLPEGRVINILLQICGSLSEAHHMGLVHRDIKPANVIVGERGRISDFVKLLDFGLVKAVDAERQKSLTAVDSITGTPMYISPEGIQAPKEVDARSDLYAIGAVGYFLLTGTPPFDATNVVELCMRVVREPLESPSKRAGKTISPDLEAVLHKCMEKEKTNRFASADEVAAALRGCKSFGSWTQADASAWWLSHPKDGNAVESAPTEKVEIGAHTVAWQTDSRNSSVAATPGPQQNESPS